MRRLHAPGIVLAATVAVLLGSAPAALALAPATADCTAHNRLTRHYTVSQLQHALNTMPADIREYYPCQDVIQNQLEVQLGKVHVKRPAAGSGGGGSSGTTVLIIVLAVVIVAGGGLALLAQRRRAAQSPAARPDEAPSAEGASPPAPGR